MPIRIQNTLLQFTNFTWKPGRTVAETYCAISLLRICEYNHVLNQVIHLESASLGFKFLLAEFMQNMQKFIVMPQGKLQHSQLSVILSNH